MSLARILILSIAVLALAAGSLPAQDGGAVFTGEVLETMPGGGYTYLRVSDGENEAWAAVPSFSGAVGDKVSFSTAMPMRDFRSNSLDRSFDLVYFVGKVDSPGKAPAAATPHPSSESSKEGESASGPLLSPPDGGYNIADLFTERKELAGKTVLLRGRVTKFNAGILGSNWLHIEDGSGSSAKGDNDLTVTTQGVAGPGDVVEIMGTLALDKDFGAGYVYALIVENAVITKE